MIKVISAVIKQGDKSFSITLQPNSDDHWFATIASGDPGDMDWIEDLLGERPGPDVNDITKHVEQRVKETGAQMNGWHYYHDFELPGHPETN